MNYTTTLWDALLLSFVFTSLLCAFLPCRSGMNARQALLCFCTGMLLMAPAHLLYKREEPMAYLYMLICFAVMCVHARLWSGISLLACIQRVLSLFLITDCLQLSISHISFVSMGSDIFRSTPLHMQLPALVLLFALCLIPLMLLRRILPEEPCADVNSLWLSFLATLPYLFISQITIWLPVTSSQITLAVPVMVCVSCTLAIMLIISMEGRLNAERERRDMLAQHHVMQLQQRQYEMSKTSQENIRRNYHDMKNLLLYLENAHSREDIREHLQHILEEIRPYETLLNTGSEVLDILLSEKLMICQREGIACSVMADGAALSFIKPLDLVSMLGNAMDNAIEACQQIQSSHARYIQLRTARRQGFMLLLVRNSCTGEVNIQGDRYISTKSDSENHGFGLPSIRRCVQNYGGEMTCRMEDGEFILTLLFPLTQE